MLNYQRVQENPVLDGRYGWFPLENWYLRSIHWIPLDGEEFEALPQMLEDSQKLQDMPEHLLVKKTGFKFQL